MGAFVSQKKLHKKYMFQILIKVKEVLSQCASLVDVAVPESNKFTVCGDVHGVATAIILSEAYYCVLKCVPVLLQASTMIWYNFCFAVVGLLCSNAAVLRRFARTLCKPINK